MEPNINSDAKLINDDDSTLLDLFGASVVSNSELSNSLEPKDPVTSGNAAVFEVLTTKLAVEYLVNGTLKKKVCRYCLKVVPALSELDQVLQVGGGDVLYKVTIREMIASIHPIKVVDDPNFPNRICEDCVDRTLSSYLFKQQCERSERALRNCFDDIFEKLEKLDPMEKQKKRGRQKLNPNPNKLYTEHRNVIDYAEPLIALVNISSVVSDIEVKKFTCSKCCEVFPSLQLLMNHEKIHPKSMWHHCHVCGRSFVKQFHLRRHIQFDHAPSKPRIELPTHFKCLECGALNQDHITHMQHIEKHKFKVVMEHLVTRKIDKLCAVCFNKGPNFVEMDNMVRLHGGYPEMMGDMTIYSILGSTVPEKSSHKYQELLTPLQAKILKIGNISKNKDATVVFTTPIVISKDKIDLSHYSYSFSAPNLEGSKFSSNDIINKAVNNNNKKAVEETFLGDNYDKNNSIMLIDNLADIDGTSLLKSCKISNGFNANSSLAIPALDEDLQSEMIINLVENTNDLYVNSDPIKKDICKICWIFKKPVCKNCLNKNNVETTKPCQMCWMFKNCNQCSYCKQSYNNNVLSTNIVKEFGIGVIDKSTKRSENEIIVRKRKITNHIPQQPKKAKWQCHICLTSNSERELCLCCEAPRFLNDDKPSYSFNKNVFTKICENNNNLQYTIKTQIEAKVNIHEYHEVIETPMLKNSESDKIVANTQNSFTADFGTKIIPENNNQFQNPCHVLSVTNLDILMSEEANSKQDNERSGLTLVNTATNDWPKFQPMEEMDTSEYTPNNELNHNNVLIPKMQLQQFDRKTIMSEFRFSIGSHLQVKENDAARKFKRAHRKINTKK